MIILPIIFLCSAYAYAGETQVKPIPMIVDHPSRPYTIISPISASKGSTDKAFARLSAKAYKMGADAVIEVSCMAGQKLRTGLLQVRALGSDSVCQGLAVKWTGN